MVSGTGDLTASTLESVVRLEAGDGKIVGVRTRSMLVWRCASHGWKIVREHNSNLPISPTDTDTPIKTNR